MPARDDTNPARLRIALCTAHLSRHSGGLTELVPILADALREAGAEADIVGVRDPLEAPTDGFAGANVHALRQVGPRAFGYAPGFAETFARLDPDVIDTQHLWMFPSLAALRHHRRTGTPLVVTPHGMLDRWAVRRSRLKKKLVRLWFEDAHLARAACFRALNRAEAAAIREFGATRPIFVVPDSMPLPDEPPPPPDAPRVLLFLGRVDPKKGIRELLEAWAALACAGETGGWRLEVTGTGPEHYLRELQALVPEAACTRGKVVFTGDRRGEAKRESFERASAFILPSYSEGQPIAIMEAWSFGRPVLMTDACNLTEAFDLGAAIRVGTDPEGLAHSLRALFAMEPDRLAAIGANGRALVAGRFSPAAIGRDMLRVYSWAAGRGAMPADLAYDEAAQARREGASAAG